VFVLVFGFAATYVSFVLERGAVNHSDQLLLRQEAVQGSLVLSAFIGDTPAAVTQLANDVRSTGVVPPGWKAAATKVASANGYNAMALLHASDNRFVVVASVGVLHSRFGNPGDASIINALDRHATPFSSAVGVGSKRWLTQLVSSSSDRGYVIYSEQLVDNTPVSLNSLPGRPFAGIEGAVYVGRELPADLVLSTTVHLPLTGQRAVSVISSSGPFESNPASLSSRVGSQSDPGGFILVVRANGHLSGATSAVLPWLLLLMGFLATTIVAGLLLLSENRRARMATMVRRLEVQNGELDRAMILQRSAAARFSALVRSSTDLTTVISSDGTIGYQSPSSFALLGYHPSSLVGRPFVDLVHSEDRDIWDRALAEAELLPGSEVIGALHLSASDGSYVAVETRITNLLDNPAVTGIVLNSRDVTDHQRLESELRHQAFHDSLTGLANRALFEDRLENAITRLQRSKGTLGVLFLDVDDFKAVNDGRGHNVGDELLRAVSQRLLDTVRAGDTLARIGGDEFAVLIECEDPTLINKMAERILESLKDPVAIGTGETCVRVSIGVASTTGGQRGAQELLRDADVAMYAAKNAGKGRIEHFHPGLHDEVINRLQLEVDLGRAVDNDELSVAYQAVVDLVSGRIVGMEALMRWEHPQRGTVMPGEFIPVAESTGQIIGMGKWMLSRACRDARAIQVLTDRPDLHLAVNLSIRQIDDQDMVDFVETVLRETGFAPNLLTLEITESVFMGNPVRSLEVLERLKGLGVRLSIDDFGTGFSSLGYLNRLPVDELKIDRTFVAAIDGGEGDTGSLVETIVRLAHDLGLGTVAEGIETVEQLDLVRATGCRLAQGYLFARPAGVAQLLAALAGERESVGPQAGFGRPSLVPAN
jgi:diguanylate cyclase (GGDEF)-like protein/PAS domain S-box-containing protein